MKPPGYSTPRWIKILYWSLLAFGVLAGSGLGLLGLGGQSCGWGFGGLTWGPCKMAYIPGSANLDTVMGSWALVMAWVPFVPIFYGLREGRRLEEEAMKKDEPKYHELLEKQLDLLVQEDTARREEAKVGADSERPP